MSEYFPKRKPLGRNVKVELDLSNYATKADLKNAASAATSKFAKKVYLASLKSEIDKLDIGKLEITSGDLSKLSYVVKNKVVVKDCNDELVKKVNAIQTSNAKNLVKKADYNT